MSMIELSLAMMVSIVLLLLVGTTVGVFSKAEANVVKSADAAAFTRLTLLQLQADIQSAVPVNGLSTVAAYNDTLKVTTQPSGKIVTWTYNPSAQSLTRQVGSGAAQVELTNVTNGTVPPGGTGIPVFHYYDNCGNDLVADGTSASGIAQLATVVQITLSVAGLNTAPYGTTTSVNVMNRSPGDKPCGAS
jgi:hypothetical protein